MANANRALPGVLLSKLRQEGRRAPDVRAEFVLRNTSGRENVVRFVGTDCGCAVAIVGGKRLLPDDSFTLEDQDELTVHLRFPAPQKEGKRSHRAAFRAADSEPFSVSLSVNAYEEVAADPHYLTCKFLHGEEEPRERALTVFHTTRDRSRLATSLRFHGLPPCVSVVNSSATHGPVELEPGVFRQEFRTVLRISPADIASREIEPRGITVAYDSGESSDVARLEIPVSILRTAAIEAVSEVDFGFVRLGETGTRRVLLRAVEGRAFAILGVSGSSEAIEVEATEERAKRHWLDVTFRPERHEDSTGWIEIETDDAACPRVRIELRAVVRGS